MSHIQSVQGTLTMASIFNSQPQVHVASKIDTKLYLGNVLDINGVRGIATGIVGWHACTTLEEWPHHGGWITRADHEG